MSTEPLSLLNLFEVELDGQRRHFVCFLEAVRAGAEGISERAVVGEYTPGPDGGFDPQSFRPNQAFIEALVAYMNDVAARAPEVVEQARSQPGGWLYLIDPRCPHQPEVEPAASDVVGGFVVDDQGAVVPDSFQYHGGHLWFDRESGPSGLLADRRFYEWLNPAPA